MHIGAHEKIHLRRRVTTEKERFFAQVEAVGEVLPKLLEIFGKPLAQQALLLKLRPQRSEVLHLDRRVALHAAKLRGEAGVDNPAVGVAQNSADIVVFAGDNVRPVA